MDTLERFPWSEWRAIERGYGVTIKQLAKAVAEEHGYGGQGAGVTFLLVLGGSGEAVTHAQRGLARVVEALERP